jgi:hypothetical protein
LGICFCRIGKKREERFAKTQLEEIDQQMQTMSKQMEQEKKTATRANKLVASLFPQQIHDRILQQIEEGENSTSEENEVEDQANGTGKEDRHKSKQARSLAFFTQQVHDRILQHLEKGENSTSEENEVEDPGEETFSKDEWASIKKSPRTSTAPIADLFPGATISFADIVGFTAWSSTREPCQVFSLLENIYRRFDR